MILQLPTRNIDMNKPLKLLKIPYGIAGIQSIRSDGYAYVDKTRFIENLENSDVRFAALTRPERFGKSLFAQTLWAYYDLDAASRFESTFSGTFIGSRKSRLAGRLHALQFNFAGLSSYRPEEDFLITVRNSLHTFFQTYPHPRQQDILHGSHPDAGALIEAFFQILGSEYRQKVFVIIDDYDHLLNKSLHGEVDEARTSAYAAIFLDFFQKLRCACSDSGPVAKIFVTGESSAALSSMKAGAFINPLDSPAYATMSGFTETELRELIPAIIDIDAYGHSVDDIIAGIKERCPSLCLSADARDTVFNPSVCLFYLGYIKDENEEPVKHLKA